MVWLATLRILSRILIALTSVCFFYQLLYLIIPLIFKKRPYRQQVPLRRYGILIAARNEEKVLPHLLQSIQNQDYPQERLTVCVIADNCTDATAQIAQRYGARVFQRFDTCHVGKGYALSYLLEKIKETDGFDRFDAFMVFDADNLLQHDYFTQLQQAWSDGYEAFCGYRNTKNFGSNWICAGYGLWYLHESTHLNRSRMLIGSGCAVSGTGFGFTRQLLEQLGGWHFFTLTEDLEFNAWCATNGVKIGYCHDAVLYDEQPLTFSQSWRQRTRWAQGGMQVSVKYASAYLRGMCRGNWSAYASFETATLSMWGFALAFVSGFMVLLLTLLESGFPGLFRALASALVSSYCSLLVLGGLTLAMEWKRIRASWQQKLISLFTFPLFMMTFLPITLAAPFQKFRWDPIAHTVAVTADSLQMPSGNPRSFASKK